MAARPDAQSHAALADLIGLVAPGEAARLSAALLREFGSLPALLAASVPRLDIALPDRRDIAALVTAVRDVMRLSLLAQIISAPILPGSQEVVDYLHAHMAHEPAEQLRVLYLDTKNRLISDEVVWRGTVTRVDIFPREIIRHALDLGATGLIMAHNHPSGDPQPSRGDISATRSVADAARLFEITLHDHIIVGRSGWRSLRNEGYL